MILLVTKDLFFVPTLQAAAQKHGSEIVTVLSIDSAKFQSLDPVVFSAWVVDLNCVNVDQLAGVFALLCERFPGAKRIAFGAHVQEQRLHAAREAGCEQVLTRGQLSSHIDRLMLQWIQ